MGKQNRTIKKRNKSWESSNVDYEILLHLTNICLLTQYMLRLRSLNYSIISYIYFQPHDNDVPDKKPSLCPVKAYRKYSET